MSGSPSKALRYLVQIFGRAVRAGIGINVQAAVAALEGQQEKSLLLLEADDSRREADHVLGLVLDLPEILALELQHLRHAFTSTGS